MDFERDDLNKALDDLTGRLLKSRNVQGFWTGHLSSSALSTATAVFALAMLDRAKYQRQIENGLIWLCDNVNSDGGWGDTTRSESNISTTMLCWAALTEGNNLSQCQAATGIAGKWLIMKAGSLEPIALIRAINTRYKNDRTFSSPILTMCALAGKLGDKDHAWQTLKPLPFEMAALPHQFYKIVRLPVVSYAMPALIAVGQVIYHNRKPRNLIARIIRHCAKKKTLRILESIQPENGGFLEAVPLTSFVVMSLVAIGQNESIVVKKGLRFLLNSVREDGSWPIDTNLATWVTTLAINALAESTYFEASLSESDRGNLKTLLLSWQHRQIHIYTHAAPGGWAWTDAAGAVPDADDTAGVLIALRNLNMVDRDVIEAAEAGIKWLLEMQNRDGGIPTFCRGWNRLPFDRSSADLTAHAITAMDVWRDLLQVSMQTRVTAAIEKVFLYLHRVQRKDGAWVPLWFGNQFTEAKENPVYGTARVLKSLAGFVKSRGYKGLDVLRKGGGYLIGSQNPDGGWGGDNGVKSSIEETSLAVSALVEMIYRLEGNECDIEQMRSAVLKGGAWLMKRVGDLNFEASPIGLYFAKLWYYEDLYPVVFALSALTKIKRLKG